MDLPEGLVLIDGQCVLCSASFRFVARRDAAVRFRFAPLQTPFGRGAAGRLGIDPDDPASFAVMHEGRALLKSDGALHILARLPGWRWTRHLRRLPRGPRDWVYDRVARNRYRMFGRLDQCMVPSPDMAGHMLVERGEGERSAPGAGDRRRRRLRQPAGGRPPGQH